MMKIATESDAFGSSLDHTSSGTSKTSISIASVMQDLKEKFKNDEDDRASPFQGLDKATVLQETKIFSDATTVTKHPKKCCQLIIKLLHILTQGEPFTSKETTDVFFGVTKLFQSKDAHLRRMMYLFIKEVAEATAADEVIIVTQSLTKDMSSEVDLYRANALRVLCRIIDGSMLNAIERYIKQAIVDRNAIVASSALVSGLHLIQDNSEVVRRWVNEVKEAVNSPHKMVQYHGVSLLYQIRRHDKLAVSKTNLSSSLALCILIRYTANLLREDLMSSNAQALYQYLEKMLRDKDSMVAFEAARSICVLPVDARDMSPAISSLQMFLGSPKPTLRFAAARVLSQVALTQPMVVTRCNDDLETLISDSNRSIATLAITTLLKTGTASYSPDHAFIALTDISGAESSVDRLMKQISTFMGDIADEFKIVVVEAIKNLCIKYPQKYRVLLNFLANFLREEGGYEFKKTITDSILFLIDRIPDCKESGLLHLCEFIEDCEFTQLSIKILRVLGQKGPTTSAPARYIRFIRNRVILENAPVRASAVSALSQFAIRVESLTQSISSLLQCCKLDDDDEVRDRATMYLSLIEKNRPAGHELLVEDLPVKVGTLHLALEQYQLRPTSGPLTFDSLPHVEAPEVVRFANTDEEVAEEADNDTSIQQQPEDIANDLYKIPQFADLGALFRSSKPIELTEAETEYVVSCVKHVFPGYIVLQYKVTNTVDDQLLSNIHINLSLDSDDIWQIHSIIPVKELRYGKNASCYVCLEYIGDGSYPAVQVANELKFKVHEVNTASGEAEDDGFDEEYPLEDMEVAASDFMAKVPVSDFRGAWEQLGDAAEVKGSFGLKYKTLVEAVAAVIENLGMQPCDNTSIPRPDANAHVILLSGVFVGNLKALVKCRVALNADSSTTNQIILQIAVRSQSPEVSQIVMDCIR
ncbi:unnamed protein product [Albugo candida]|uniref:Coatomer subunit gamma n=2 Tax=Albugo candida TaxID=65357 RepID=A0A024GL10_9STRA|nr:unnamed protein product [Albugo candida]|eukprot:CCI47577.1 unnamed protein product [Albugo candida]